MTDETRFRREFSRWIILLTLNNARPTGARDSSILQVLKGEWADFTLDELRREIDYLRDRRLIDLRIPPDGGAWQCALNRAGVDVVEYSVEIEPGIARPLKYHRM
jgi:predicted alpha/beta-hydrolase family hydrolase